MNSVRLSRVSLLAAVSLSSLAGCGFLKGLVGRNSVDLSEADVKSVSVDLRKDAKTICPRQAVQMAVFANVMLKGEKQAKNFETYIGGDEANRNDKLEFSDFAFYSDMGAFDEHGRFAPQRDLRLSLDKEFEIKTAYKRRPDKFTFASKYKPDYACIKAGGGNGKGGIAGRQGPSGQGGSSGQYGGANSVGGRGGSGSNGGPGGNGSDGQPGPNIKGFATLVKTPFYEKLVAVRVSGDVDDLLLFPSDQPFTLAALGGAGGAGGSGGNGGSGGGGGAGFVGGDGGSGGMGGPGGQGGRGGPGGSIELTLDPAFPELGQLIKVDVSGGAAGAAGRGGSAGSAGSGGSGTGQGAQSGQRGAAGTGGTEGTAGMPGPEGRAGVAAGPVNDRFADISALTLLSAKAASATAETPVETTKESKKGGGSKKGKLDDPKATKKPSSSKSKP
jgi:hypothetical protein